MRKAPLAVVALAAVLALGGCGLVGSGKSATPSHTSTAPSALNALLPVAPKVLTSANAKTETVRLADAIDALVASSDVIYIDNHAELVAATKSAGSYYGVLRTITVAPALDPIQQATAMETLLVAAGWTKRQIATDKGKYLAALSSDAADPSKSWFLLLGGDSTVAKSPVVTVQVASPDLPSK